MKAKALNSVFRDEVVALLGVMDQQLGYGAENGPFTYIQQRKIINSLFAENAALEYAEKVILRLIVIDSLYSTNAAYSYFSFEEMAEKIVSLGPSDEYAADYFYDVATRKQTGRILFDERYGIRKNLERGSRQISLLSKYAYYLLQQDRNKYPLGFPIYDSLALKEYPKLCKRLNVSHCANKDIKDDIDAYVAALDELRKVVFEGTSFELQQFDLLDAYLWRMGKVSEGNFSLLVNRAEYNQLIANLGLVHYVSSTANEEEAKEDKQFASKVVAKCAELSADIIVKGISDIVLDALVKHWKKANPQENNNN
ncbi:MAG: hypothetical protein II362_02125 [Alistipes sp.]|nr:hypothetical protein [Alistipes sp.]MBQ5393835.1 hypothetical protein [Alistipes sp.]MBQ5807791.1 hypothetical protein [Tidjanibacter sp.]MBQ5878562.1 hypothetical protein [Alistipes sp.]MBR0331732.1 hypothetical protein [Alistipes sp.]